jgi:hypothetical protein
MRKALNPNRYCPVNIRNRSWVFLHRKSKEAKLAEGGFYEVRAILCSLVSGHDSFRPAARTTSSHNHAPNIP